MILTAGETHCGENRELDPVFGSAPEVDLRRTRQPSLFPVGTHDFPRARLEGGHLSSIATLHPVPIPVEATTSTLTPTHPIPSALHRACLAAKIATDNKGQDVVVLDLRPLTPVFDFFVIATGASRRQVHAIVEDVDAAMRATGDTRAGVEGYDASKWVVQDYGDVLVHVFDPDTRGYYNLEELWADAKKVDWELEVELGDEPEE